MKKFIAGLALCGCSLLLAMAPAHAEESHHIQLPRYEIYRAASEKTAENHGEEKADVKAYNIDGYTYLSLVDIAKTTRLEVAFDGQNVQIDMPSKLITQKDSFFENPSMNVDISYYLHRYAGNRQIDGKKSSEILPYVLESGKFMTIYMYDQSKNQYAFSSEAQELNVYDIRTFPSNATMGSNFLLQAQTIDIEHFEKDFASALRKMILANEKVLRPIEEKERARALVKPIQPFSKNGLIVQSPTYAVYVNGVKMPMNALNINGHTYLSLKDLSAYTNVLAYWVDKDTANSKNPNARVILLETSVINPTFIDGQPIIDPAAYQVLLDGLKSPS